MATLIKTLTLTLDSTSFECQLDQAELVDNPTTEDVTTFCGTETFASPRYQLNLGGFQDWGDVNGVCDILHTAYIADPVSEIDFVLTVGGKTRSGVAKPVADVPFGGNAGSPLKFSVTLDVIGTPVDGTAP
jgi:hypothetical protein